MINIYDFDGVLCHPLEDCVFRLPVSTMDDEFIGLGRKRYGITRLSNHIQRNRHILLQEVLYERKICPEIGPMFSNLEGDPFYVLTARSGPGAVARVSQFFEKYDARPEEMFFVGPTSKNHMLIDLCAKFPHEQLFFFDDNQFHIDHANELHLTNLRSQFVDNKPDDMVDDAERFYLDQLDWLRKAS